MPPFVATMRTSPARSESSGTGTLDFEIVTPPSVPRPSPDRRLARAGAGDSATATTIAFVNSVRHVGLLVGGVRRKACGRDRAYCQTEPLAHRLVREHPRQREAFPVAAPERGVVEDAPAVAPAAAASPQSFGQRRDAAGS
jgi:hypothetical protein